MLLLACRDQAKPATATTSDRPARSGSAQETSMDFQPLPSSGPVTIPTVARAVAAGTPDPAAAERRLTDAVLRWRLRNLDRDDRPRELAQVVYDELVERLGAVAPERRLAVLDEIACEATAERLVGETTSLAVARYLLDHPGRTGGDPWRPDAARWQGLDAGRLAAEAATRIDEVERLQAEAPSGCRRAIGQKVAHARMAATAARTGAFTPAAGMLLDFLRAVGERPQEIDVH